MFNFERIVHKMSLIHDLTDFVIKSINHIVKTIPVLIVLTLLGNAVDLVLSVRSKSTIIQKVGDLYITVKIISITTQ